MVERRTTYEAPRSIYSWRLAVGSWPERLIAYCKFMYIVIPSTAEGSLGYSHIRYVRKKEMHETLTLGRTNVGFLLDHDSVFFFKICETLRTLRTLSNLSG